MKTKLFAELFAELFAGFVGLLFAGLVGALCGPCGDLDWLADRWRTNSAIRCVALSPSSSLHCRALHSQ